MKPQFLIPDWPAPAGVRAASTLRQEGYSRGAYASLNLGDHVGDDPAAVSRNRALLAATLELPGEPVWLTQVHGRRVVRAEPAARGARADASFSECRGQVCAVMTADCLPILLCDAAGAGVAAVHGGWRGLAEGVLEATLAQLPAGDWLAWLGPAIGPGVFEVGDEVYQLFCAKSPAYQPAFRSHGRKWLADIYRLARIGLMAAGVTRIYGGGWCTYSEPARFFSYRREQVTGRMASLIWLE